MIGYRHKVDANQAAIVDGLRKLHYSVLILSAVGGGCPDLLVGWGRGNLLLEVKQPKGAKVTPAQVEFRKTWNGPVYTVTNLTAAIAALNAVEQGD